MPGRFKFFKWQEKRAIALLVLTVILSLSIVGGTLAYIFMQTPPITNTFTPAVIKSITANSQVGNTGDVPSYVRVATVFTWVSTTDSSTVYAIAPVVDDTTDSVTVTDADCTVTYDTANWTKGSDGFWYYKTFLKPISEIEGDDYSECATTPLISECVQTAAAPEGYKLNVEIITATIQAEPTSVVTEQWDVQVEADGSLTVN